MRPTHTRRIAELLSVPEGFVVELWEAGVVTVHDDELEFEQTVERVRISWTLHDAFGVNLAGIEVALHLLSVIQRDRSLLDER